MKERSRVSIRTLAESLGVSSSTVSRALRSHPGIPYKTRKRILDAAAAAGYEVNPLVSNVMRGFGVGSFRNKAFSGTLAYLTGHRTESAWRRYSNYLDFYEGAKERAEQLGFQLDTIWARQAGLEGGRLDRILAARGIKGVIFSPWPPPMPPPDLLDWNRLTVVQVGMRRTGLRLNRVTSHLGWGMEQILHQLLARGYQRPGCIIRHDPDLPDFNHGWLAPFSFFQTKIPPRQRIPALEIKPGADVLGLIGSWYDRHKPDAVIGPGDVVKWLTSLGINIPEDTGFANIDVKRSEIGVTAGIDQNPRLIGAATVNMLVNDILFGIQGLPEFTQQRLIIGKWVDGPSLRPNTGQASDLESLKKMRTK